MSVERISARRHHNGNVLVTMELPIAAWAALETAAACGSHPDAADYLAAVVNMLVLEASPRPDYEDDDADPYGDGIPF